MWKLRFSWNTEGGDFVDVAFGFEMVFARFLSVLCTLNSECNSPFVLHN